MRACMVSGACPLSTVHEGRRETLAGDPRTRPRARTCTHLYMLRGNWSSRMMPATAVSGDLRRDGERRLGN